MFNQLSSSLLASMSHVLYDSSSNASTKTTDGLLWHMIWCNYISMGIIWRYTFYINILHVILLSDDILSKAMMLFQKWWYRLTSTIYMEWRRYSLKSDNLAWQATMQLETWQYRLKSEGIIWKAPVYSDHGEHRFSIVVHYCQRASHALIKVLWLYSW